MCGDASGGGRMTVEQALGSSVGGWWMEVGGCRKMCDERMWRVAVDASEVRLDWGRRLGVDGSIYNMLRRNI